MYQQQYVNRPIGHNEYLMILRHRLECLSAEYSNMAKNISDRMRQGGFQDCADLACYTQPMHDTAEKMQAVQALIDGEMEVAAQNKLYSN
ncbi:hypothetical protein [Citrobacter freundii]|uniref:hypothetical protein n=1 Tax=Citrobacter freundii TaxID=546 RepID=UPI0022E6B405|nr:hypothetical protein [Citrobacter freundii]